MGRKNAVFWFIPPVPGAPVGDGGATRIADFGADGHRTISGFRLLPGVESPGGESRTGCESQQAPIRSTHDGLRHNPLKRRRRPRAKRGPGSARFGDGSTFATGLGRSRRFGADPPEASANDTSQRGIRFRCPRACRRRLHAKPAAWGIRPIRWRNHFGNWNGGVPRFGAALPEASTGGQIASEAPGSVVQGRAGGGPARNSRPGGSVRFDGGTTLGTGTEGAAIRRGTTRSFHRRTNRLRSTRFRCPRACRRRLRAKPAARGIRPIRWRSQFGNWDGGGPRFGAAPPEASTGGQIASETPGSVVQWRAGGGPARNPRPGGSVRFGGGTTLGTGTEGRRDSARHHPKIPPADKSPPKHPVPLSKDTPDAVPREARRPRRSDRFGKCDHPRGRKWTASAIRRGAHRSFRGRAHRPRSARFGCPGAREAPPGEASKPEDQFDSERRNHPRHETGFRRDPARRSGKHPRAVDRRQPPTRRSSPPGNSGTASNHATHRFDSFAGRESPPRGRPKRMWLPRIQPGSAKAVSRCARHERPRRWGGGAPTPPRLFRSRVPRTSS